MTPTNHGDHFAELTHLLNHCAQALFVDCPLQVRSFVCMCVPGDSPSTL
jgi:hypothetical protein